MNDVPNRIGEYVIRTDRIECPHCNGQGFEILTKPPDPGVDQIERVVVGHAKCDRCAGTGKCYCR